MFAPKQGPPVAVFDRPFNVRRRRLCQSLRIHPHHRHHVGRLSGHCRTLYRQYTVTAFATSLSDRGVDVSGSSVSTYSILVSVEVTVCEYASVPSVVAVRADVMMLLR
jgi:hypothetical protein